MITQSSLDKFNAAQRQTRQQAEVPQDLGFIGNLARGLVEPFSTTGKMIAERANQWGYLSQNPQDQELKYYQPKYTNLGDYQALQERPVQTALGLGAQMGSYLIPGVGGVGLKGALATGALLGGTYGAGTGLRSANPTLENILGEAATGAIGGAAAGGITHGLLSGISKVKAGLKAPTEEVAAGGATADRIRKMLNVKDYNKVGGIQKYTNATNKLGALFDENGITLTGNITRKNLASKLEDLVKVTGSKFEQSGFASAQTKFNADKVYKDIVKKFGFTGNDGVRVLSSQDLKTLQPLLDLSGTRPTVGQLKEVEDLLGSYINWNKNTQTGSASSQLILKDTRSAIHKAITDATGNAGTKLYNDYALAKSLLEPANKSAAAGVSAGAYGLRADISALTDPLLSKMSTGTAKVRQVISNIKGAQPSARITELLNVSKPLNLVKGAVLSTRPAPSTTVPTTETTPTTAETAATPTTIKLDPDTAMQIASQAMPGASIAQVMSYAKMLMDYYNADTGKSTGIKISAKDVTNAKSAIASIEKARSLIQKGNLTGTLLPDLLAPSDVRILKNELKNAVDIITRIRTGAALNESEVQYYSQMAPQWYEDMNTVNSKLDLLESLYQAVASGDADSVYNAKSSAQ